MDWSTIAHILGDQSRVPLALLDRAGRTRLINRAMEEALDVDRASAIGQPWWELCVPVSDERVETKRWLDDALAGLLRAYDVVVRLRCATRMRIQLDLSPVGRGRHQALLVAIRGATPVPLASRAMPIDLTYEITVAADDFGSIQRLCDGGAPVPVLASDRRCHVVLHDQPEPCRDCPLQAQGGPQGGTRTNVRLRRLGEADRRRTAFEIVTAEMIAPQLARLRSRIITEDLLTSIHELKLQSLAERAQLSEREREVLRYLLMGRNVEDIAKVLEITPRTVKYHQGNILEKVGADSRVDLVRFFF